MSLHLKTTTFTAIDFERLFAAVLGIVFPHENWQVKLDALASHTSNCHSHLLI